MKSRQHNKQLCSHTKGGRAAVHIFMQFRKTNVGEQRETNISIFPRDNNFMTTKPLEVTDKKAD